MTAASARALLLERDAEVETLRRVLDRACAGQGAVVLIEGPPGIGKTRLLDELCSIAERDARVLRARGGEQERELSMLATRELLMPYVASASPAELEHVFAGAAALAGPLLGRGTSNPGVDDFGLVHGLYWLVANLADEHPLVLCVDDAHWLDDATQRWLAYLLPRLHELPVLLGLTARPGELAHTAPIAAGLSSVGDLVTLRPGALSPAGAAAVVRALLPSADEAFCGAIHRNTGGYPLLVRNLATAVADAGLPPTSAAVRRLDELGSLGLGRILLPRLHRLGPDCVELARAAALLGDACALELASALAGLGDPSGLSAFDRLVAADVLVAPPGSELTLTFHHPLVRAAVSDELSPGRRQALHLRAARLLVETGGDEERAASHLTAAGPVREPWATATLQSAARLASTRGAPQTAATYIDAALRGDVDPAGRCHLLLEGGAYAFRAADPRGLDWLRQALASAPDPGTATLAWAALINWRLIMGEPHDAAAVLEGLPPPADLDPESRLMVRSLFLLDVGFTAAHLRSELHRCPEPDVVRADSAAAHIYACAKAFDAALRGRPATTVRALAAEVDVDVVLAAAGDTLSGAALSTALACAGDLDPALDIAQRILERATETGATSMSEGATSLLTYLYLERGEIAHAEASVDTWLHSSAFAVPLSNATAVGGAVTVYCECGRLEDAEEMLRRWAHVAAAPPDNWHGVMFRSGRARLRRLTRDTAGALEDVDAIARILRANEADATPSVPWRLARAECVAALGDTELARSLVEEQLEIARSIGARPLLGRSLLAAGILSGGRPGRATIEEAIDVLDGSGAKGEHARALLGLGRQLRLDRRPADARKPLEQALALARRTGALQLGRQIEDELGLCGARQRRRAVTGVHSLTPAELRVCQLASQGHSNPEIAQSLFVTRKTVEKHLGAAFGKLHISSRDQLAVVLGGD